MTPKEAATALDGSDYGAVGSTELFAQMAKHDLVAVFGSSDDNMEFEGKIRDEVGCYGGGTAYLNRYGLLVNECEHDNCPYFDREKERAATIEAQWDVDGVSWRYETNIPHETFTVNEDGNIYCIGIVFSMGSLKDNI